MKTVTEADPDGFPICDVFHRLVECMGCMRIKYVTSILDLESARYGEQVGESNFQVYPDSPGILESQRHPAIAKEESVDDEGNELIPEPVWKMYRETIDAYNAKVRTLAGGGLRAVVEDICIDKNINGSSLLKKIDALASQGYLTAAQADLLHEERYIGNAALHEMATPSKQDLEDGLEIVEGLIRTIYILPYKAKRLKVRREAKQAATTKPKLEPPEKK